MTAPLHTPLFTHEYDDGPSGKARSYWDIRRGTKTVLNLALLPRHQFALLTAQAICYAMDQAFQAGQAHKAQEMRDILGIKP